MKEPKEITTEKEARERGKQMARDTIKKLEPEIKAIASIFNKHDERIIREAKKQERSQIIGWIEDQKALLSGGSLSSWTDELVERLKALPPFSNV